MHSWELSLVSNCTVILCITCCNRSLQLWLWQLTAVVSMLLAFVLFLVLTVLFLNVLLLKYKSDAFIAECGQFMVYYSASLFCGRNEKIVTSVLAS